jgi:predicted lipid-binding transport protein (Tim44 family)
MGNGFQFIDIILFAMIAAFLILRLRGVLGRRDGHDGGYNDPLKTDTPEKGDDNNVVQLPGEGADSPVDDINSPEGDTLVTGLSRARIADPSFETEEFLAGARIAFEMILGAFTEGDKTILEELLSSEAFDNFRSAIDDRKAAGHVVEETLVGIRSADIVEVTVEGTLVQVATKFLSEQVHVVRNDTGDVIEGNPNQVIDVVDVWTFARDASITDPNWKLVATRSLD